jgi:hypothetical protein
MISARRRYNDEAAILVVEVFDHRSDGGKVPRRVIL